MAYAVKNIIVGAAALYVSALDSTQAAFYTGGGGVAVALPTLTASTTAVPALEAATGATVTSWKAAGFTTNGIEVSYEPDYGDIAVDQLLDSAKLFKQGMRVMVNTSFAEATLENLLIVWGQQTASLAAAVAPDATGGQELGIAAGGLGDEPVERSVVFVGPAPRVTGTNKKRERLYQVRRALSVESTTHTLARSDSTVLPVSFRVLPDPSFTGKEYGIIRDRQIEA